MRALGVPGAEGIGPDEAWRRSMRARLFEERTVVISGVLGDQAATDAAAELMTLDATGDDAIDVRLDSSGGSLAAALALIDVIDLLGVPARMTALGQVRGPALGVLAVGAERRATPSTRLQLSEPPRAHYGDARQLERWAALGRDQLLAFCRRLAEATGQPVEHVEADVAERRWFSAEEALAYGLIDEVARPSPRALVEAGADRPPMGFGRR